MNNNNRLRIKKKYLLLVIALLGTLLFMCSCNKGEKTSNTSDELHVTNPINQSIESSSETSTENDSLASDLIIEGDYYTLFAPNDNYPKITWAIDTYTELPLEMNTESLDKINTILHEHGIEYSLQIVAFNHSGFTSSSYTEEGKRIYEEYLKKYEKEFGTVDILSAGSGISQQEAAAFLKSGYFYCLDDYLNSEKGKELYERFAKNDWKLCSIGGKIYSIPMNNYYVINEKKTGIAFNLDMVPDINEFDGTFASLIELHKKYAPDNNIVFDSEDVFLSMLGYEIWNGLCYSESENKFYDTFDLANVKEAVAIYDSLLDENNKTEDYLIIGNVDPASITDLFAVGMSLDGQNYDGFINYVYDTYSTREKYFYTNGIRSESPNVEASLEILNMVYSDSEIADLLLFGGEKLDSNRKKNTLTNNIYCFGCLYFCKDFSSKESAENKAYWDFYNDMPNSRLSGFDSGLTEEEAFLLGNYSIAIRKYLFDFGYEYDDPLNSETGLNTMEEYSAAIAPIIEKLNNKLSKQS